MPSKALQRVHVTKPSVSNSKSTKPDKAVKKVVVKGGSTPEKSYLSALKTEVAKNQGFDYPVLLGSEDLSKMPSKADKKCLYNIIRLRRKKNISRIICQETYFKRYSSIEMFTDYMLGVDNKSIFYWTTEYDELKYFGEESLSILNFSTKTKYFQSKKMLSPY